MSGRKVRILAKETGPVATPVVWSSVTQASASSSGSQEALSLWHGELGTPVPSQSPPLPTRLTPTPRVETKLGKRFRVDVHPDLVGTASDRCSDCKTGICVESESKRVCSECGFVNGDADLHDDRVFKSQNDGQNHIVPDAIAAATSRRSNDRDFDVHELAAQALANREAETRETLAVKRSEQLAKKMALTKTGATAIAASMADLVKGGAAPRITPAKLEAMAEILRDNGVGTAAVHATDTARRDVLREKKAIRKEARRQLLVAKEAAKLETEDAGHETSETAAKKKKQLEMLKSNPIEQFVGAVEEKLSPFSLPFYVVTAAKYVVRRSIKFGIPSCMAPSTFYACLYKLLMVVHPEGKDVVREPDDRVAKVFGITVATLNKHFSEKFVRNAFLLLPVIRTVDDAKLVYDAKNAAMAAAECVESVANYDGTFYASVLDVRRVLAPYAKTVK